MEDIATRIHPQGARLFSGVLRPDQFPAVSRIIFRVVGARYGDYRDWPEIDAWADQIADQLQVATGPGQSGDQGAG